MTFSLNLYYIQGCNARPLYIDDWIIEQEMCKRNYFPVFRMVCKRELIKFNWSFHRISFGRSISPQNVKYFTSLAPSRRNKNRFVNILYLYVLVLSQKRLSICLSVSCSEYVKKTVLTIQNQIAKWQFFLPKLVPSSIPNLVNDNGFFILLFNFKKKKQKCTTQWLMSDLLYNTVLKNIKPL